MNALAVTLIVLACVLGGAALGMVLRKLLPEDRFSDESKDLIKLGTALLSTLTALVLGLLITSSKSSADVTADEIKQIAAKIIQLDRNLRHYGPEANEVRDLLRRMVTANTDLLWTGTVAPVRSALGQGGTNIEDHPGEVEIACAQQRCAALAADARLANRNRSGTGALARSPAQRKVHSDSFPGRACALARRHLYVLRSACAAPWDHLRSHRCLRAVGLGRNLPDPGAESALRRTAQDLRRTDAPRDCRDEPIACATNRVL